MMFRVPQPCGPRSPSGLLAFAALALAAGPMLAATWYVATNGNHTTGDTWANAYTNLQAAVTAAASDDTILLKQGLYISTTSILVNTKSLTIQGGYLGETPEPGGFTNDPAATILDGGLKDRVIWFGNCATGLLERLTIRNGSTPPGAGLHTTNSTLTIRDCVIRDNTGAASTRGLGVFNHGTLDLIRCKLRNNSTTGGSTDGGALFQNSGSLRLESCWVAGNRAGRYGAGLYINASTNTRIVNSLLVNNSAGSLGGGLYVVVGTVTLANCTVAGNSPSGLHRAAGTVTVTNSIFWNNSDDLTGAVSLAFSCIQTPDDAGPGVIHSDPEFQSGFRLPAGNPCIDAGGDTAANLGLNHAFTEMNVPDSAQADLGYHYPTSCVFLDVYVSPSGTDDASHGSGPGANAFRSVTYALGRARDDTRIFIEAGTYGTNVETFPVTVATDHTHLLGTNADRTVFTALGATQAVLRVSDVVGCVLSNLTLRDGRQPAAGVRVGGGLSVFRSDAAVSGCEIRDNLGITASSSHGGGVYMDGGSVRLLRCKIRNNRVAASSDGGGLYRLFGNLWLDGCEVVNNRNDSGSFGSGGGLHAASTGRTRLNNCLVANNSDAFAAIYNASGLLSLNNTTLAHNRPAGLRRAGGTVVITNSILWANGMDLTGLVTLAYSCVSDTNEGVGVIHDDPRFTARYRLEDGSPCIDAGGDTAANLGLAGTYTQTGATDMVAVDLGYHDPGVYRSTDCFVSPLGTDAPAHGTGPGADAFRSVTYALAQTTNHVRIFIESGDYTSAVETFPLTVNGRDDIHLLGTNAGTTLLNATNLSLNVVVIANALDCSLSNLTVTGGNPLTSGSGLQLTMSSVRLTDCDIRHNRIVNRYINGGGLYASGGSLDLLRCKLRNNRSTGSVQGGGLYAVQGNLRASQCVFADNYVGTASANVNNGGGLAASTMGYVHLAQCLFVNNDAEDGDGIYTTGGTAVGITNCTIANNLGCGYFSQSAIARIWNSIIWSNLVDLTGTLGIAYSSYQNTTGTITDLGGNTNVNPLFTDAQFFHLQSRHGAYEGGYFTGGAFARSPATSPLLDAGDPAGDFSQEPAHSRGLELGAYGNTPSASRSAPPGTSFSIY